MDLSGLSIDMSTCVAAALIIITGLSVLWGFKKAIAMFMESTEPQYMTPRERATGDYLTRESIMNDGWTYDEYRNGYKEDF